MTNHLLRLLDIQYPIIQAPMAGVSNPQLAAIVSNCGGLGSLGLGAVSVEDCIAQTRQMQQLTAHSFNLNFFCHAQPHRSPQQEHEWLQQMNPALARFGQPPLNTLDEIYQSAVDHAALYQALIELKPKVVSFHFGLPKSTWIEQLKQHQIVTMASATNIEEARYIEQQGIDVVIAQGVEAGGHSGVFDAKQNPTQSTFALTQQYVAQLKCPVVASGGLMTADHINHALALGAQAVQLGTAFVACHESSASAAYRHALADADRGTAVTRNISGRPARGLINEFYTSELTANDIPNYPLPYDFGKRLNQAALAQGSGEYGAFWAGENYRLAVPQSTEQLMQQLIQGLIIQEQTS